MPLCVLEYLLKQIRQGGFDISQRPRYVVFFEVTLQPEVLFGLCVRRKPCPVYEIVELKVNDRVQFLLH
jgi:hypothetical protein